jgi:hypothetical protein
MIQKEQYNYVKLCTTLKISFQNNVDHNKIIFKMQKITLDFFYNLKKIYNFNIFKKIKQNKNV